MDGFRAHLIHVPWEDIFKPSASATAREFCESLQDAVDICIPHFNSQVRPHSAPSSSAACAAAMLS